MAKTLVQRLTDEQSVINHLKMRYFLVHEMQTQMSQRFGRRLVEIKNDFIWQMALDCHLALTIHFASWANAMCAKGGFFGQLNAARGEIFVPLPDSRKVRALGHKERLIATNRRASFEAAFPGAKTSTTVRERDINRLRQRFSGYTTRIRNDRDKTLAHLYEANAALSRRLVTPRGFTSVFTNVERLLNQLRMVLDSSQYGYHRRSAAQEAAGDVIDLVTNGSLNGVVQAVGVNDQLHESTGRYFWQFRSAYNERRGRRQLKAT